MNKFYIFIVAVFALLIQFTNAYSQDLGIKPEINIPKKVANKPVIGISATTYETSASAPITYINSIKRAGGVPLVIPMTTSEEEIAIILNTVDAIVMTGGEDICPSYYGEEPIRAQGEIVPIRDEFDYKLIKMAVNKGLPVLGICRGLQIMNVAFGGTLYQDFPSQNKESYIKHNQKAPRDYGTHSITIDSNSLLYQLLGVSKTYVNSYHHQAIKDLAPGFKISARSADGIVEAIEMTRNDLVLGVQFHPEGFVNSGDDFFLAIFEHLVDKAKGAK